MQKKTIRKVLVRTLATGLFLFVLSLNLTVSLTGGWSLGFNKARANEGDDSKKYFVIEGMRTCTDFTATRSIVTGSSGTVGVTAQLGPLGTYSAGVNPGTTGTSTSTVEIAVQYPKNANGSYQPLFYRDCINGGTESCTVVSPCMDVALSQLGIQP